MTERETKPMKRYQPHRSWGYRIGYACGHITAGAVNLWLDQPTWARTMVYILIGYAIGSNWAAWVS